MPQSSTLPTSPDSLRPQLLLDADGSVLDTPAAWYPRRRKLLQDWIDLQYGGLPSPPGRVRFDPLCRHRPDRFGRCDHEQWRIQAEMPGGEVSFTIDLLIPGGHSPEGTPVLIHGDGCWITATDKVIQAVLSRGYALLRFNRVELAPDHRHGRRIGQLYCADPGTTFGAIAAWAWGYHRCMDFTWRHERLNAHCVSIVGHSRGGKAVLLAAASDTRISAVSANNSGCGGAGSYQTRGENCERISHIVDRFPYWFGPRFPGFANREDALPFDQHVLLAGIAPRGLLTIEGNEDLWANPHGTNAVHAAARCVYELLEAGHRQVMHLRPKGHGHLYEDWITTLDFLDGLDAVPVARMTR